jgi:hypothetical protein
VRLGGEHDVDSEEIVGKALKGRRDEPRLYASAVSMKLIPASNALWMIRIESSWSELPTAPNIIAPS